jgi:RHS repeat-associated protein
MLSNHLGNVLATVSDKKIAVMNGAESFIPYFVSSYSFPILKYQIPISNFQSPNSSPAPMTERTALVTPTDVRYGFNGKEVDSEGMGGGLSTYDYGFRIYNPHIAKFLSTDPLSKDYPWYTPYQFAGNKPIVAIDVDGLEEYWSHRVKQFGKNLVKKVVENSIRMVVGGLKAYFAKKVEDELIESDNHVKQSAGLFVEFFTGTGQSERYFGPDEPITKSLKTSNLTEEAVEVFWEEYQSYEAGERDMPTMYVAEMGWPLIDDSTPLQEGLNAAQFVGSATFYFDYDKENELLNVTVFNSTGQWSFLYHQGEQKEVDHERGKGDSDIMATISQEFKFSLTKAEVEELAR